MNVIARWGGVVLDDALRPQDIAQVVELHAEETGYNPADFSGHSLLFRGFS